MAVPRTSCEGKSGMAYRPTGCVQFCTKSNTPCLTATGTGPNIIRNQVSRTLFIGGGKYM